MRSTRKTKAAGELRENEKKWGPELLEPGWTLIPNVLLTKQHALGLSPVDINILLQILKHWWRAGEAPFPSQQKLARLMNVDPSTVKRHLRSLRELGFIDWKNHRRKDGGNAANRYDFSGLIEKARPYALEENAARREASDERHAKSRRKRARSIGLRLVQDDSDE